MNSSTTLPSLNALTAGIDWMPKAWDRRGFASVSTFTSSTWPVALGDGLLDHGAQGAARAAPFGPEVDDHGMLVGALDDVALEGGFSDVSGHTARIVAMDLSIDAGGVTLSGEENGRGSLRSFSCTA